MRAEGCARAACVRGVEAVGRERVAGRARRRRSTATTTWPTSARSGGSAATVALGDLSPDDVAVELVHGRSAPTTSCTTRAPSTMGLVVRDHDGRWNYEASFACERPGRYGFTVRVVPAHPDLTTFAELGRVTWA